MVRLICVRFLRPLDWAAGWTRDPVLQSSRDGIAAGRSKQADANGMGARHAVELQALIVYALRPERALRVNLGFI